VKHLLGIAGLLLLTACASEVRRPAPEPMSVMDAQYSTLDPRIDHTCYTKPIYDINGNYVRTFVRCW
jgi:hypothetical protein